MPAGGWGEDSEEEQVFQSPEWTPTQEAHEVRGVSGASPQLRRSARKRKSTAGDDSLLKVSESKKKKRCRRSIGPRLRAKLTRRGKDKGKAKASPLRPSS